MRQLPLLLLSVAAALAAALAAPSAEPGQFLEPCTDDGLAHIPDLPEGHRRPYSVRKRSRTAHRDPEVTDDTPQLPPGRRRFDAVLPDEQGHDITSSTPGRSQRRLAPPPDTAPVAAPQQDANEVPYEEKQAQQPRRRPARRPAYPKKVIAREPEAGENYPADHPAFHHDPKQDAVVDSYEAVRKYPTHLPQDLVDDDNLSNDLSVSPAPADQLAQEDVSTEQQQLGDNRVPESDQNPPGYRSKFPQRTFASDAGGSGDVLRVKPRRRPNNYREAPQEQGAAAEDVPPRRQQVRRPQHQEVAVEEQTTAPESPSRQRYRASHRVDDQALQARQRRPASRRRGDSKVTVDAGATADSVPSQAEVVPDAQLEQQPLRRRPRPRPTHVPDVQVEERPQPDVEAPVQRQATRRRPTHVSDVHVEDQRQPEVAGEVQRQAPRRRPRPRPTPQPAADTAEAVPPVQDVLENTVSPQPDVVDVQPQRRPLRRRPRPRTSAQLVEEELSITQAGQDVGNAVDAPRRQPLRRRPRPQQEQQPETRRQVVTEESYSARGYGRGLPDDVPQEVAQVIVEHDGTAAEEKSHEPTLVRSAVKKVPSGGSAGNPSPALIQKIVKNTLRRLQPQIAEHEGDVGVDILVKIIQVDDE